MAVSASAKSFGPIFAAQPAALTIWVSFIFLFVTDFPPLYLIFNLSIISSFPSYDPRKIFLDFSRSFQKLLVFRTF